MRISLSLFATLGLLAALALAVVQVHAQSSPEPEGSRIMTIDGPDCETHAADFTLEGDPAQVQISGLEKCLAPDSSDGFSLTASNLDAGADYTVTLAITGQVSGRFGFNAGCTVASLTYDSGSATTMTQSPTLYSCGTTTAINVLHAALTQAEAEIQTDISRTSDYLLFIIPPPQSGDAPRGPGITHAPSASVSPKPTSITRGQTTGQIFVTLSGLDFGHAGGMELQSSNNSVVGHAPSCSAGLARTWGTGNTSRSFSFRLKACAYGSVTMRVTAYQQDSGGGNIHAHGTRTSWGITVPEPNRCPVFTDGTTTTRGVDENTGSNTNIGSAVSATDADGDRLTYSSSGADAASFGLNTATGQLRTGSNLDHEAKSSYSFTMTASDGKCTDSINVIVSVGDEDEPPRAPGAPTVTATPGSTTRLDVSWTAPANDGRPPITSYDLQYRKERPGVSATARRTSPAPAPPYSASSRTLSTRCR